MKQCIIMRGIPGSGKSTYVKQNLPLHAFICSADKFFMKPVSQSNGAINYEYQYDASKSAVAHSVCLNNFISAIFESREDVVVVDNTNIRVWEFQNYIKLARLAGYYVTIIEMRGHMTETGPEFCANRNQHAVPVDIVMKMHGCFEELDQKQLPNYVKVVKGIVG